MKKNKQLLLGLAALAGVATPLVALSAGCAPAPVKPVNPTPTPNPNPGTGEGGSEVTPTPDPGTKTPEERKAAEARANVLPNDASERDVFDTQNTTSVKIGVSFSKGQAQWKAIETLANDYNKIYAIESNGAWVKKAPHELAAVPEGQDPKTFYSTEDYAKYQFNKQLEMFLPVELVRLGDGGYPAADENIANKISAKNKTELVNLTLNYAATAAKIAQKGMLLNFADENPLLDSYDLMKTINPEFLKDNSLTSNVVNSGLWIIPSTKSGNVVAINAPVLSYILETMETNGATIELRDYQSYKTQGANDRTIVKSLWGEPLAAETIKGILGTNYTVDESTFDEAEKLLDFAIKAQKMFTLSSKANSDVHLFGIDDAAGFIATLTYAQVDADDDNMYVKAITQETNGYANRIADYSAFKDKNSKAMKGMEAIYDKLVEAMKVGAVVLQGNGEYTSTSSIKHKYALGFGSSAGYKNNYVAGSKATYEVTALNNETRLDINSAKFGGLAKSGTTLKFTTDDGAHWNTIFYGDEAKSKYNLKIRDEDKAKVTALLDKITNAETPGTNATDTLNQLVFVLPQSATAEVEALKSLATSNPDVIGYAGLAYDGVQDEATKEIFFVFNKNNGGKIQLNKLGSEATLQENELFAISAPTKFTDTNEKNIVYVQGPSLMGIHSNETGDKATKLFVKYYLGNNAVASKVASSASYIYPSNELTSYDTSKEKNKFLVVVYQQFKNIINNENYKAYSEIGDINGNIFRNSFKSAWNGVYTSVKNNTNLEGFNTDIIVKVEQGASAIFN
ncbi:P68 family surface lipoprotein [Mycoplasmopsis gallinarum]